MSRFSPIALGLALPMSLVSTTAFADLTPAQVWGDWRTYLEGMGYTISADEVTDGGNVTVSNLTLGFQMPEDGSMDMSLGQISFNQNSDGTVAIILPEVMPITMSGRNSGIDGEDFTMTMNYSQTGHAMTASGTPEQTTYLYTAQTLALALQQMQVGDEVLSADQARINVNGSNLNTTTTMTISDARGYQQTGSIDSVTYDIFFVDQENDNTQATINGSVSGVTMNGTGTIPLSVPDAADMSAMLAAGFDVSGTFGFAQGSSNVDVKDPANGNFTMQTTSSGGTLGVDMGSDGLAYNASQRDLKASVGVEGMPFPFEVAMAEGGFNLAMPVSVTDDAQNFGLGINLSDFTMSDMLWSMFDPAAQLPRDPATILVDLSGTLKLLIDWMNPEAAAAATGAPAELETVKLGNLLVSAAGAKLEGSGDLEINAEGPPMVPGVGTPVGEMNFALAGGNALLDKLVAMGLLPQDQAMGARMMMGLFAVPGDAPDTLKSKIEFTADGQILANGQRIR